MEMEENAKQVAELLKVLANENRLLIFCALTDAPMTVGEIHDKVANISQPALSQHLHLLKAHGILASSKSGQSITYSIADTRAIEVIKVLKQYYCN